MVSKIVGVQLKRGQSVRIDTPGGGGYGPPSERTALARSNDLKLGYVTEGET
jgi:N-methylhydantoinase B